ncbi:MAG: c-type cytochrome [Cyclobacteriaceae bacterium]|nr:c-type cytochrome [Cyclobacteriaceae bacterium]
MSRHFIPVIILLAASVLFLSLDDQSPVKKVRITQEDSLAALNKKHVDQVMRWLGDRAKLPAEEVFKDIEIFRGRTAEEMIDIMDRRYRSTLGVSCAHCHDPFDWASNEKPEKEVTRAMVAFTQKINNDLLANMQGLKSENPRVRCSTCHRGNAKP